MKSFKDFNITAQRETFVGDKIRLNEIIDRQIIVEKFLIEPSKFEGKEPRLKLQIKINNTRRIHFNGSAFLKDMIKQVPIDGFPFTATIKLIDGHLEFQE